MLAPPLAREARERAEDLRELYFYAALKLWRCEQDAAREENLKEFT